MDALKVNEISQVIQSPFGMHLIQVQERREQDVSAERKRVPPVRPCVNASLTTPIRTGCANCATAPTSKTDSKKSDAAGHCRDQR
jgi:hypothetical protein